jgi:hypothetical protein
MVQLGSSAAIAPKASSASVYQNECSSATARLNLGCAALLQEVLKLTLPSTWRDDFASSSWASECAATSAAAKNAIGRNMGPSSKS